MPQFVAQTKGLCHVTHMNHGTHTMKGSCHTAMAEAEEKGEIGVQKEDDDDDSNSQLTASRIRVGGKATQVCSVLRRVAACCGVL